MRQTKRLYVTKGGYKSRANQDKALAVIDARDRKPRGTCWNCSKKGYHRARYSKPSKNKKGMNNKRFFKKGNDSVNAIDFDLEADRVYAATYDSDNSDSENDSIYPQESIYNNEDWFSEVAEDEVVVVTSSEAEPASHIELYDSSCSTHITPYHEYLENYSEITPKTMNIANKQSFHAVGKENMTIEVPNSTKTSELKLTKVLYSPEVGYTLVSIGKLDKCSFQYSFGNRKYSIFMKKENKTGEIPKNAHGLYKYTSKLLTANAVK